MNIIEYVQANTEQITEPEEGAINMEFFHVRCSKTATAEEFKKLSNEHQGEFCASSPFDGAEQNYMKLGGWIGDQGLAMRYMALGVHLKLFKLLTPSTVMPFLPPNAKRSLAERGMVCVQAQ